MQDKNMLGFVITARGNQCEQYDGYEMEYEVLITHLPGDDLPYAELLLHKLEAQNDGYDKEWSDERIEALGKLERISYSEFVELLGVRGAVLHVLS